jgi:hypothetical protein
MGSRVEIIHYVLLETVHAKPFKQLKGGRAEWSESLDLPVLQALLKQCYHDQAYTVVIFSGVLGLKSEGFSGVV